MCSLNLILKQVVKQSKGNIHVGVNTYISIKIGQLSKSDSLTTILESPY